MLTLKAPPRLFASPMRTLPRQASLRSPSTLRHCQGIARPRPASKARSPTCTALPQSIEDALKQQGRGKPTDREVVSAATAALEASSTAVRHSRTALGYLMREAPQLTWLPLLCCAAAAGYGIWAAKERLVWGAVGGMVAYVLTIWQVLLPLVRRFQALRRRLLDSDRASKSRLDAAAQYLEQERNEALQEAQHAVGKLNKMEKTAGGPMPSSQPPNTNTATSPADKPGGHTGAAADQHSVELEREREEWRRHEQRRAGILNNALNAAAVPTNTGGEGSATSDLSSDMDMLDGYGERPIDRNNAVEVAGALQARVDALRRQALQAADKEEEVRRLGQELAERERELEAARGQVEAGGLPARSWGN